jgi:hypothetical protein
MSWDNTVHIMNRPVIGQSSDRGLISGREEVFLVSTVFWLALGPIQSPIQWVGVGGGRKWPVRKADYSHYSGAEVKNGGVILPFPRRSARYCVLLGLGTTLDEVAVWSFRHYVCLKVSTGALCPIFKKLWFLRTDITTISLYGSTASSRCYGKYWMDSCEPLSMCKELLFQGILDVPSVLSACIAVLLSQLCESKVVFVCAVGTDRDYVLLFS